MYICTHIYIEFDLRILQYIHDVNKAFIDYSMIFNVNFLSHCVISLRPSVMTCVQLLVTTKWEDRTNACKFSQDCHTSRVPCT